MKSITTVWVAVLAMCVSVASYALGFERYIEGVHYEHAPKGVAAPNTVVEFFSFGCPHCAHLEPALEKWLATKPVNVTFKRIPAIWNPSFGFYGQVYYTLQEMGLGETLSQDIFNYLHEEKKPLRDQKDVKAFLADKKVDVSRFDEIWSSDAVKEQLNQARDALTQYNVKGVPSFVVGGTKVTSISLAGSQEELFEVINFLLTK